LLSDKHVDTTDTKLDFLQVTDINANEWSETLPRLCKFISVIAQGGVSPANIGLAATMPGQAFDLQKP